MLPAVQAGTSTAQRLTFARLAKPHHLAQDPVHVLGIVHDEIPAEPDDDPAPRREGVVADAVPSQCCRPAVPLEALRLDDDAQKGIGQVRMEGPLRADLDRVLRLDGEARHGERDGAQDRLEGVRRLRAHRRCDFDRPSPPPTAQRFGKRDQLARRHVPDPDRALENRERVDRAQHPHAVDECPALAGGLLDDLVVTEVDPVRDQESAQLTRNAGLSRECDVRARRDQSRSPAVPLRCAPH